VKVLEEFSVLIFRIKSASIEGEQETDKQKILLLFLHILWSSTLKILYIAVLGLAGFANFDHDL
jgi:hypothetical protein